MKKTFIVTLLILQSAYLFAKTNKNLDNLFSQIMNSEGLARTRLIDKLSDYPLKKVVNKTKFYLKSSDTDNKEAAAEISGIIKSKSYEKIIKKEFKKAKDFRLINSLIFSIGENKYHKLGNMLCKYIDDKKHKKPAFFALIKLNDSSCFKQFRKILQKKAPEKQLAVIEFITKTKNKKYQKSIKKLFKKTRNSSVKYASGIALLTLGDSVSLKYIKNYLNKELDSQMLELNAYKSLEKLLDKNNPNTEHIFQNCIKNSKNDLVKMFCITTMVKKDKLSKLAQKDIDFIESFSQSNDVNIYMQYSEFRRYLTIYNNNHKKETKKILNDNEEAIPQ